MNLNTIRLEGKLETDEFFHLADEQGILVMARLVLLRPLGALEGLDPGGPDHRHRLAARADAAPAPPSQPAGLAQRQRQSSARRCGARLSAGRIRDPLAQSVLSSASATPTTVPATAA